MYDLSSCFRPKIYRKKNYGKKPKPTETDIPPNWRLLLLLPICNGLPGSGLLPTGLFGTDESFECGWCVLGSCSDPLINNGITFSFDTPALHTGHVVCCVFNQRNKQDQQYKCPHCVTTGSLWVISKHILHIKAESSLFIFSAYLTPTIFT